MSSQHVPYTLGYTHPTMANNKEQQVGDDKRISQKTSQFGLKSATRLHEAGIASNRRSAMLR